MKRIIILLLLFPVLAIGQTNYIKNTTYKQASATSISNPSVTQAAVSVTYFDGLGRPVQQIAGRQAADGKDIVTPIVYDSYGRQAFDYLPFPSAQNNQAYQDATAVTAGYSGYAPYSGQTVYSEKAFEASPLNRVLKQSAPGNDWNMANNHVVRMDSQPNAANEVKKFTATATWSPTEELYTPALVSDNSHAAGELYKSIVKNENWVSADGSNNTTEDFTDREGHLLLKRRYNSGVKHDTYYVYDPYGNLTFVIPPLVNTDAAITTGILDNLCYQYKYDHRNRMVEKKLPGKQWEFIVYDNLDRVVATGPANSPFTDLITVGWTFSKYDAFGRTVLTGWLPVGSTLTAADRKTLQSARNAQTTNLNEAKSGSDTTVNSIAFRYTTVAWPTSGYHVLTVNYFDDYSYTGAPASFPAVESQTVGYTNTAGQQPKGLATGAWVRALQANANTARELTYSLYDAKGRVLRTYTTNFLGGYTQADNSIDPFSGKLFYTVTRHKRVAANAELYVKDSFTYTDQERLLTHIHQVGSSGTPQLLSKNTYNALGQLTSKKVGGTDVTTYTGLQKVDYRYNIRGWLTAINDVDATTPDSPADFFDFKINYNTVEHPVNTQIKPLYNGNIAETYWRGTDNIERSYGYRYDHMSRLTRALYHREGSYTQSFNEELTYDKNGNITHLDRYGGRDEFDTPVQMDYLDYTYHPDKKNQLMTVLDGTNDPQGFKDDSTDGLTDPNGDDYAYDLDGNLIGDQNKGIMGIKYNHLNLPMEITFSGTTRKITYLYDATGQKLRKFMKDGDNESTTEYLDGFQYNNDVLQFFPTAEGYVKNTVVSSANTYDYVFNYTDHLGNIRLRYGVDPADGIVKVLEENHYYPFGLKHTSYNQALRNIVQDGGGTAKRIAVVPNSGYQYKYNGKEFQDEMGLNVYDYGARNYDPALGRWMNIDPLAEQSRRYSPYAYALDNPVFFVDPDGMRAKTWSLVRVQAVNDDVESGEYLENRIKGDDLNQRANELAVDSVTNLASTFVNSGMIVEHRDDGDDKIYEVGNDWKPGGSKKDLKVVGKEKPGVEYKRGYRYNYEFGGTYNPNHAITPIGGAFDIFGFWDAFAMISEDSNLDIAFIALVFAKKGKVNKSLFSKTGAKVGENSKKMTLEQIETLLGKNWHSGKAKKDFLKKYSKALKGDTNADFYLDKTTKQVFLKSNKSKNWVPTGTFLK